MEWLKDNFSITTLKNRIDIEYVHRFLSQSYWAEGIPMETVRQSINGSLCFSLFYWGKQIGFARVITDEATFAYLCDVFIDEEWRGKGLSKWLMEVIINYPGLQGLRRFALITRDAHNLYSQFGFEPLNNANKWMQVHKPGLYKVATQTMDTENYTD
jgi:GNAT superfamily N-acetyltransferase